MNFVKSSFRLKQLGTLLLFLVGLPVFAQTKTFSGVVFSNPKAKYNSPYKKFAPYEIPFHLPRTIKDNTPYRSVPFYAIVLRRFASGSATECDGGEWTTSLEKERVRLQKLFPSQKVFASYQCPDMGALSYTMNGKIDNGVFIAVWAGNSQRDAQKSLVQAKKVSSGAKIYRTSVAFERIMQ